MHILLAFPQEDRETGLFIKNAFEKLEHKVTCVDAKLEPNKLLPTTIKENPDAIFCSRTPALIKDIILIHNNYSHIKIACWNVDVRKNVKEFGPLIDMFANCDILYTTSEENVKQYQKILPKTIIVKHLQQACDPYIHKIENLTEKDHKKYDCDVMFAGSYKSKFHSDRVETIDYIKKEKFKLKLFGYKNSIFGKEQNKANRCAKIVLSLNGFPQHAMRSVRDYKVMASGGFLLARHSIGIDNYFEDGKHLVTYKTKEECIEKIKYYLDHENERLKIAKEGSKFVREKHTYYERMKEVLADLEKIIQKDVKNSNKKNILLGISEGIGNQVEALTFINAVKITYEDSLFDILYMEGSQFEFTKYLFENDSRIDKIWKWDDSFPKDKYDGVIICASTCKEKPNKVNCPDFSKFKISSHIQRMNTSEVTLNLLSILTPNENGSFGLGQKKIEKLFSFEDYLLRDKREGKEFDIVLHNGCNRRKDNLWFVKSYDKFPEVAKYFVNKGLKVACIGSNEERINGCENLTGISFEESIKIINKCKVFCSTDTGTYHIRAALKKPGIVLFTATSYKKNWDKNFHKTIKKITHDPICGHWPCQYEQGTFWYNQCKWNQACRNILPKRIIKEIEFLLSKGKE